MAAATLRKHNIDVVVVDKGKGVGGRLATRRIGRGNADHGAQFFTVRSADFARLVEDWHSAGLVYRWSSGWSDGSLGTTPPDGYPRYAINGGMTALAKHLARGVNILANTRLIAVRPAGDHWEVSPEAGANILAGALILTPPVPQSLALLDAGGTVLSELDRSALQRIEYAPCLAGLYRVDGKVDLPEPGALQRPDQPISWIANNQRKGISPEETLVTVHAGPAYSRQLWELPDSEVLQAITAEIVPILGKSTKIIETQLKRWRYALPVKLHSDRCLTASNLPPLIFAGDAFGEPRVEGAALSGMATATKLLGIISNRK
jgi:predicted NAD/FAD-dependent oxidoreductase